MYIEGSLNKTKFYLPLRFKTLTKFHFVQFYKSNHEEKDSSTKIRIYFSQISVNYNIIITKTMRGNVDASDSQQKDILIATMKKELYDLKQLNHEHLALIDEVKTVESKHNMLEDQNARLDNQYKTKSDLNRKVITQLRNQADNLKIQIHKCSVQIDDIIRENMNLKRVCENRDNEITSQMSANQELQKTNYDQNEANQTLGHKIKALKDERNKCEGEYERLKRTLDEQITALKALEKEARHLDANNSKLDSIINIAEKDHSGLVEDLKVREEKVSATTRKLDELKQQREDLRQKSNRLEKECMKSETDLKNVCSDLDASIIKNKELTRRLKNEQNNLRTAETELERSRIQRQALNKEHIALDADHKALNGEIDRCLMSILEYEKINQELQREMQHFMECDEQARSMLNRKDAMKSLLDQVASKLHKTSEEIAHLR